MHLSKPTYRLGPETFYYPCLEFLPLLSKHQREVPVALGLGHHVSTHHLTLVSCHQKTKGRLNSASSGDQLYPESFSFLQGQIAFN